MLEVTLYARIEYNALLTRRYYVFTVKLFDEEMYNGFERGGGEGGGADRARWVVDWIF